MSKTKQKPKQIPSLKQRFSLKAFLSSAIEKHEKICATLIVLLVLIFVHAPILYFSLFPKEGLVFLGRRVTNQEDVYTYISYIEQAKQGKWLLMNMFTSEPQIPSLIRPSYVLVGKFAKLTNLSSLMAYHIAKIVFALPFFLFAYELIQKIFKTSKQRLLAFFILLTSSGLFWIYGNYVYSTDFYVVESNTYLALGESPHLILSLAFMLLGILLYLKFIEEKKFFYGLAVGVAVFPLAFEHPYDLMTLTLLFFLTGLWAGVPLIQNVIVASLVAIPLVFPFLQLKQNTLLAAEQTKGALYSLPLLDWIFGFGLLLPLAVYAVYGMKNHFSKAKPALKILITWVILVPFLLNVPVSFQRRLSEGSHIPIALLATLGLVDLYSILKKKDKIFAGLAAVSIALILTFTPVQLIRYNFSSIGQDSLEKYYYYIAVPERDAISWIKENTPENAVILSNWFYGNIIAGSAVRQVYIGHKLQTFNFDQKVEKVNQFLLNTNNTSAYQFLKEERIQYIFTTKYDTLTTYGFTPDEKPYLEKVYDHDGVFVYHVKENY